MNENLDLSKLLAGHEGESFYSPICGDCKFYRINETATGTLFEFYKGAFSCSFDKSGQYINGGECMLFPSKDQRDWSVWEEQQKPKRWRAKVDEIYYLINFDEMDVFFTRDLHLTIDDSHFSNLNYFRTAEQAKEAAKRIKQTLQNYHKEIGE